MMKRLSATILATSMLLANASLVHANATPDDFAQTKQTAIGTAAHLMEQFGITGLTMSLVDAQTGYTWTQGLGYADTLQQLPVDEHTLFQIGSVSKHVTAIAIMQLVEQGVIDLDEPIVSYIPEFSLLPHPVLGGNSDKITPRMLLTNTSGIITDWMYAFFMTGYEHYQGHMNHFLEWVPTRHMRFEAGAQYEYANAGWTLLGILVSRMMAHDNYFEGFHHFTQEHIFEPLGMDRSTFVFDAQMTNFARPYRAGGLQDEMNTIPILSAGSMFSSAYEMSILMHTLLNGGETHGNRILAQESVAYMMKNHLTPEQGGVQYGFGLSHSNGFVGHGGGTINYFTMMQLSPEHGLGVFVSTNTDTGAFIAEALADMILQSAIAEKFGEVAPNAYTTAIDPHAVPVELPQAELEALVGIYNFTPFGIWNLEVIDGVLTWTGESGYALIPMSDGSFDSPMGRYIFTQTDDSFIARAHTPMGLIQGERITTDELQNHLAPAEFAQFMGLYHFVPQVEGELVSIPWFMIFIDELGIPMALTQLPIGPMPVMLLPAGDEWLLNGRQPLVFSMEDGVATIDMMGATFVRTEQ